MKKGIKRKGKALTGLILAILMAASLAACSGTSGSTGKNTDNSVAMIATWTTSGLVNHYDSKTSCDLFATFVVEGLWGDIHTTDKVYCELASELPAHTTVELEDYRDVIGQDLSEFFKDKGCTKLTVTTAHIRPEAKWHNGDDFKAKDVWAYYYIIQPATSNYLAAVKVVDDKTVEFIWNPLKEPNNELKDRILSQDICGTVKYEEFAQYADAAYDLVMEGTVNRNVDTWGAFGRIISAEQGVKLDELRTNFQNQDPSWYVATGPFKLSTFSATQILLVKNENYWAADDIGFEKIKLYNSSDINQIYQMVAEGTVDYFNGFVQPDTLEQMLAQNEDLVNFKMYDQGAVGITFNTSNSLLADVRVREALQYVFDREAVTMAANPYATATYLTVLGMPPLDAKENMSEKHYNELTQYSYDLDKAAQLLIEAGWEKKDGSWYANGQLVEFNMGTEPGFATGALAAEPAAAQLNAFGIKCNLLQSDNFLSLAYEVESPYDMFCHWTDLNMGGFHPTGSYQMFSGAYSRWAHLERYAYDYSYAPMRDQLKLIFNGLDGDTKTYAFADYVNNFYSLDPEELTYMIDVFNIGIAKECLGVPFFQNVTAATWNAAKVSGLPLEAYWTQDRNVTYVPGPEDEEYYDTISANIYWSKNYVFTRGVFQPNTPETDGAG